MEKYIILAILIVCVILLSAVIFQFRKIHELCRKVKAVSDYATAIENQIQSVVNDMAKIGERVGNLEKGIVPDMEAAKKAASAINDMNAGISAILGYDPVEAYRKSQAGGAVDE